MQYFVSFLVFSLGKRELVASPLLYSVCHMTVIYNVLCLFLVVSLIWSAICYCGISWSYSLTFLLCYIVNFFLVACKAMIPDCSIFCSYSFVFFNPFKPNRISHYYQLKQSISVLSVVWWIFEVLIDFW